MKNKINKYEGAKLIAAASALTVLISASAAIIHVNREIERYDEEDIYIPNGVNLNAYLYAYQNNKNVVKIANDYYEWNPLRHHQVTASKDKDGAYKYLPEEGDILAFNMKTGLPESVSIEELKLLTLEEKYEVPSDLPEGGQFVYDTLTGKITYQYYDSSLNEFVFYEIKEMSKENKLLRWTVYFLPNNFNPTSLTGPAPMVITKSFFSRCSFR